MSTEDDRPQAAGGYSDSGLFSPGNATYSSPGGGRLPFPDDDDDPPGRSPYDDSGYSTAQTEFLPASTGFGGDTEEVVDRRRPAWHAGADIGLLVLRLVVGALFMAHGLQKLFGWFNGPGIDGTEQLLAGFGYSETTILAWVNGVAELVGGTFVLLGLFTPVGAAAILGVMANVIIVKVNGNEFAGAVELESVYAAAAFALLFAGPGRISLDRPTHWYRKAPAYGVVFLLLAAAASVVTLVVFR